MINRFIFFVAFSILNGQLRAQDSTDQNMFIKKQFVIVRSVARYEDALKTAKEAASKLHFKLDLRDLKKNAETGLSFSRSICEGGYDEFPCYVARGRYDDGNYISIEYSNEYSGFKKGYYIVIISSGDKDNAESKAALAQARKYYKDAYAKLSNVYMGCMH
jgi:hypothetical protein